MMPRRWVVGLGYFVLAILIVGVGKLGVLGWRMYEQGAAENAAKRDRQLKEAKSQGQLGLDLDEEAKEAIASAGTLGSGSPFGATPGPVVSSSPQAPPPMANKGPNWATGGSSAVGGKREAIRNPGAELVGSYGSVFARLAEKYGQDAQSGQDGDNGSRFRSMSVR